MLLSSETLDLLLSCFNPNQSFYFFTFLFLTTFYTFFAIFRANLLSRSGIRWV